MPQTINEGSTLKNKTISEKRKAWLAANPDKHPWRRKNKFLSPPCEKVKNFLKELGVNFVEEFQPLLNIGRNFSIDIAFPDKKIGIEVNGNQHYNRDGTLKEYYQKRSDTLKENGWFLYELHYSLAYNQPFIRSILKQINIGEKITDFDFQKYAEEKMKKYEINQAERKRVKRKLNPPLKKEDYKQEFEHLTAREISKILNRSYSTAKDYLDRNNFLYKKSNKNSDSPPVNPFGNYSKDFFADKDIDEISLIIDKSLGRTSDLLHKYGIEYKRTRKFRCNNTTGQITPANMDICECGGLKCKVANFCKECSPKTKRKVVRPEKHILIQEIWEISTVQLAKKYGVSDVAISKWCKSYNIKKPPRGYWNKVNSGISHEAAISQLLD